MDDTSMSRRLQLEYWKDCLWFVGRLPQVPGVFSQGTTLEELEENIRDAYRMMLANRNLGRSPPALFETKETKFPSHPGKLKPQPTRP
jgi:predicted RNase H-like HicB family nuclease